MLYYWSELTPGPEDAHTAGMGGVETSRPSLADDAYAVYCHIPFCASRCSYCDFFTTTRLPHLRQAYVDTLMEEARQVVEAAGRPVATRSLYLGGGTPSVVPGPALARLVSEVRRLFAWRGTVEVTVEANPGDASEAWLGAVREAGVNRLSLGM